MNLLSGLPAQIQRFDSQVVVVVKSDVNKKEEYSSDLVCLGRAL